MSAPSWTLEGAAPLLRDPAEPVSPLRDPAEPVSPLRDPAEPVSPLRAKALRPPVTVALALAVAVAAGTIYSRPAQTSARVDRWTPRVLPGAMVTELDPFPGLAKERRPTSSRPLGGIAFVRCTRLWSALPNGSSPTRLLEMTGIASPTFSPDAKTIAFIRNGAEIWMASTDGAQVRKLGALEHDGEILRGTVATSLVWSPTGRFLAFALMSPGQDMWSGGASIWKLDIGSGNLTKEGSGWPSPTWRRHKIVFPGWDDDNGPLLDAGNDREDRRLSKKGTPYAATFNNGSWYDLWDRGTVVLKEVDGELVLGYRIYASGRNDKLTIEPPSGFSFTTQSRPALSQDVGRIVVDLAGHGGAVASGIFDLRTRSWTVLDHAWDPATSTAPTVVGPVGAKRAYAAANDLLSSAPRGTRQSQLLLDTAIPDDVFPNKGWGRNSIGKPVRNGDVWDVPATIYGPLRGTFGYRSLTIRVSGHRGRLTAEMRGVSPIQKIGSVQDAVAFLRSVLPGIDVPMPAGIPAGAQLDTRYPVEAYTWNGSSYGLIRLELQDTASDDGYLAFGYGDVSFSIGCGGAGHIEEEEIDGTPGASGRVGRTRQILWPATEENQEDAIYTVYGTLSKDELRTIALNQV